MIRVSCPKCKAILQVDDKHAGQVIACSKCQAPLRFPQALSAPPPPLPPPSPHVPSPPASKSTTPIATPATIPPADKSDSPAAHGTAASSFKDQATKIVGRLKTYWQEAKTPIKAAIIGGTSVMFLSFFLCCGCVGFRIFSPSGSRDGSQTKAKTEGETGGKSSFTQRILDLDAAQLKELGVKAFPKGAKPLYPPR